VGADLKAEMSGLRSPTPKKSPRATTSPVRSKKSTDDKLTRSGGKKIGVGGAFSTQIQCDEKTALAYKLIRKNTGSLGGNGSTGAIYGELTMGSMQKCINILTDKCEMNSSSRFIDVGAGLGKPNFHAAQDPAVRLSLGVELEEIRWKLSMYNLDKILPSVVDGDANALTDKSSTSLSLPLSPETTNDNDDGDGDETTKLQGGVNFVCGDIDDASTTDPFTHIYMYDLGFPPPLQKSIARKFNESIHAQYLVSYRPPHRVLDEYGYKVELVDQLSTRMFGSGENHMAYFYKRINKQGKASLSVNEKLPKGSVKVKVPSREGFKGENDITVACAACYADAVSQAVGPVSKLRSVTHKIVNSHLNESRPTRSRKLSEKAAAAAVEAN
jgi:hypothetical protein